MPIFNYDFDEKDFSKIYAIIYNYLTTGKEITEKHCSILLNGLPGSGKSHYYEINPQTSNYVIVDTDEFRRFHPRIDEIKKLDAENYAERTQPFASRITEKLLQDLSKQHFNLIVEGTLRTTEVPTNTCHLLKENNYHVDLVIVACDAEIAWRSTMLRAEEMLKRHEKPRLVPIDKFDYNANHIIENLQHLMAMDIFDSIQIINRDGNTLNYGKRGPLTALSEELNLNNWNDKKEQLSLEFLKFKAKMLQQEINEFEKH